MHEWQVKAREDAENQQDAPSSLRELLGMDSETTKAPIPVIVCGKAEVVGRVVIEGLKPEYEGKPQSPGTPGLHR